MYKKMDQSMKQMKDAAATVPHMMSLLIKHPALREGSFNNMLEEWCEAKLFYDFVQNQEVVGIDTLLDPIFKHAPPPVAGGGDATGVLVDYAYDIEDVVPVYLGGLVDLTGEIGRLAVAAGTKRDLEKVKQCYEVSTYSYKISYLKKKKRIKKKS
jgi:predicted translin family RNA/ssDNA-binding protein